MNRTLTISYLRYCVSVRRRSSSGGPAADEASDAAESGAATNDGESGVLIQANVMRLLSLLFDYGHLPQASV